MIDPAYEREQARILVVEDDRSIREVFRETMLDAGFAVTEATDGAEGLRAFTAAPTDLILLDAMMPVMDGITMCRRLRALPGGATIPVLMITARIDHTAITEAFAAGVTDFIQKPVNLQVLEQRVIRMVKASRAEAELQAANALLERRVQERTMALHQVNEQLVIELVERARIEAALRESETRFRLLFEHSPDAIWLLDPRGEGALWTIVDCNEAAAHMHGYMREELIGQTMARLDPYPDAPRLPTPEQQHAWRTGRTTGEDQHRRKDGSLIAIEYATMPIKLNGRDLILGVDRDISMRKDAEREREHLIQQLQEALGQSDALFRAAQSLITTKSVADVLQEVVDATVTALKANRVTLITMDMEQRSVSHFVKGGPGVDGVVRIEFDELWDGLAGWAIRGRTTIISPKDYLDPRESPEVQRRRVDTGCGAVMVAPLHYRDRMLGILTAINRPDEANFTQGALDLLTAMANQAAVGIANAELFHEVQQLAMTDALTSLYNRRGFFRLGEREVERARRVHRPLSVIMLDVDRFKQVNDNYGHTVGDQVLKVIAERCSRNVRAVDVVGRYGGEEFAVLLPDIDLRAARLVAERLRLAITETPIPTTDSTLNITVSAGVAGLHGPASDLVSLLQAADTALYAAKRAGRNCVVVQE